MKKLYFLFSFLVTFASFGQDMVITGTFDGPLTGGTPKVIEIYVINDIADLSTFGIGSANNGGGTDGEELTFVGSATAGDFIYVADEGSNPGSFNAYFGLTADYISTVAAINGDDAVELFSNGTVIDTFGDINTDGTGQAWEYLDGWAYRNDSTGPDGSTFNISSWSFSGINATDGCTTNASCGSVFPIGTFTYSGTPCGVSLGAVNYICSSNTIGDNNDGVTIEIPYTGSDAGITSVTTTAAGASIFGDDPSVDVDGTIIITGLSEGDAWDITLNGGNCDGTTSSDTVPADQCDPAPNTCFDLSGGTELFELVTVVTNSDLDEWTFSAETYNMNGYCGTGCAENVDTWLIFGPLDMTGVTDLSLAFDAAENFGDSDLVVAYTAAYSGCPSGTTWTTAQTITPLDAGAIEVDLSAASGTDVFIGVQYLDDGADGYSDWSLSNVALEAFGACPALGSRPTSDCAICDVALQTENYVCVTNTAGANNDTVTVEIPYTGSENTLTSVTTTSGGTVGGDDPASIADGVITITGLLEGAAWDLTLNGGDCDGTTISGTIPSTNCDPTFLVINELLADPDGTTGDANGDGTVSTSEDEFVEIFNTGVTAIDLTNYTISDGFGERHVFPAGTILEPSSFITVFGGGTPTGISFLSQVASTGGLGLNNGGDTVSLKNDLGVTIDEVVYGAEGGANQSLAREPDFTGAFVQHLSHTTNPVPYSPGEMNNGATLSNNSFEFNKLTIYPNPTNTGYVMINSVNSEVINAKVFDILGKQVLENNVTDNQLDVSNLNTGVYILRLTQNDLSITKKLVIK